MWLTRSNKSPNTAITYVKCIRKLLINIKFDMPQISNKDIELFLLGKTNLYFSATKNFVKYLYFEFNKKFENIDYPDVFKPEQKSTGNKYLNISLI
jgi:hypothetical protein